MPHTPHHRQYHNHHHSAPPRSVQLIRDPVTKRLDVAAAVAVYLNTLKHIPSVIYLTQGQWQTVCRQASTRPQLGIAIAGESAIAYPSPEGLKVVTVKVVGPDRSAGVKAYRRQYAQENPIHAATDNPSAREGASPASHPDRTPSGANRHE